MSSYPILCYGDMQRAVPADSGAGTRSYWVMPSNATIWNVSIFRAVAKLIYFPISVVMFSILFHRLMWTNYFYYILDIRFYFSLSVKSTSHFLNLSDFRQLQIPHAQTKYYEILPCSAFIKPDQRYPWIKDQLGNALLSTILHLQLPNVVSCGRDKPSHMTQNLVTVGAKL